MKNAVFVFILLFCSSIGISQEFTSSKLPLIIIDTEGQEIEDEPKILAACGIINNANGVNHLDDPYNEYEGYLGIEIRGQSSTLYPKKGYGIEFRDEFGEDVNVEVLGFPLEEDFVLHGPFADKTLIRNAVAYTLASELMEYAPRTRFVELFINEDYRGVYLMVEKIKRDANRVDIANLLEVDVEGEELEGGYILRFDKIDSNEEILWSSPYMEEPGDNVADFVAFEPKYDEIQDEQTDYIMDYMTDFENALIDPTFSFQGNSYTDYIDISTAIDFILMTEITKNVDGYRISTYMYKDKNDVLKIGPVWDFNFAMGNADYCEGGDHVGWQFNFNFVCPWDGKGNHFWWRRFLEDPAFEQQLMNRYDELRETVFSLESIHARIDSLVAEIGDDAVQRNFEKFPILGEYIWPNNFIGGSYDAEVQYLKDWFGLRLEFMDTSITNTKDIDGLTDPLLLYPNPNDGNFLLDLGKYAISGKTVLIYNAQGQLMQSINNDYNEELTFNLDFNSGIYFLRVINASGKHLVM